MAERAERDRIGAALAEKNTITEEFRDYLKRIYISDHSSGRVLNGLNDITDEEVAELNVTDEELDINRCSPSYEEMDVTELIIGETSYSDFRGMSLMLTDWGITLRHITPNGGGSSVVIHPDGNGGYQYYKYRDSAPIEDEQLLAAIAEGTEKYGDTFTIYY